MSDLDQRLTDARDAADDLLLGELDRAERQAWDEDRAADALALERFWGPAAEDTEPWVNLFDHHGRRGQ